MSSATPSQLEPRPPLGRAAVHVLWLAWACAGLALTLGPLGWHLGYFRDTGPGVGPAIVAVLLSLAAAGWLYHRFCPPAWRGRELRLAAALAVVVTLVQEPLALIVVGVWALACYAAGSAALRRLGLGGASAAESLALPTGTGIGLWILALIALGLSGLLDPWLFAALIAGALAAFRSRIPEAWRALRRLDRAWGEVARGSSPLIAVLVAFLPLFLAAMWLAAMAPATATDPISFHMPAARHYLATGELTPLPILPGVYQEGSRRLFSLGHSAAYFYYPQSFEALLTAVWALAGQPAAQLISPLFALLAWLALLAIGRRCGLSRTAAVAGLAAGMTIPVLSWSGAIAKNDSMLTYFELATLLCVIAARDGQPRRRLLLAAFFLGLCFGTKHVALFGAVPLGLLALGRLWRQRARWRLGAAMAAVCLAVGFSWHLRTWLATGNPVFPAGVEYAATALPAVGGMSRTPWLDRISYPWIAHFRGRLTNEGPSDNPLGFYLLFFSASWLLLRRREGSANERDCLVFCALFGVYWIYSWGVVRYGGPLLFLLTLLTAHRVEALADSANRWVRRIAVAAFAYCFSFAALPALLLEINPIQLRYFARQLDRDQYLRAMLSGYASVEFLNARMAPEQDALAVGNCALGYARDPLRFRCIELRGPMSDAKAELIGRVIQASGPEYLVLPTSPTGEALRAAAEQHGLQTVVYQDSAYLVLE